MMIKILSKLDDIAKDVSDIKVMDAIQNEQLKEHMRRSDLLETRVEQVDKHVKSLWKNALVTIAAIAGLALTIKELLW